MAQPVAKVVGQVRGVQRVGAQRVEERVGHAARHAAEDVRGDAAELGVLAAVVRRAEEGEAARRRADGAVFDVVELRFDESLGPKNNCRVKQWPPSLTARTDKQREREREGEGERGADAAVQA